MDVEDGTGREPAALGEDKVGGYLQAIPLLVPKPLHLEEEGPEVVHQRALHIRPRLCSISAMKER